MGKSSLAIGALLAAFGLLFAGLGGAMLLRDHAAAAGGLHARGTVIELVDEPDSEGDGSYHPRVAFRDRAGVPQQFVGRVGANPAVHSPGEKVAVIYSASDPSRAMVDSGFDRFLLPVGFTCIGALFAFLGLGLLAESLQGLRESRRWRAAR